MPHIKISEKHEKSVKWILRILTLAGIVSALFTFATWYYSLLFAVGLFLVEQIFEQIIFTHNIMLVQPMPNNWDGSKWTAMLFGQERDKYFLGFCFSDKNVAIDFFDTIFAWNNNETENTNNIQLSLVWEDKKNYSVHIYPTAQRRFVTENYARAADDFDKRKNAGKELGVYVAQISFCKVFPISPSCAYNYLQNHTGKLSLRIFDSSKVDDNDPSTYQFVEPFDDREIIFSSMCVVKRKDLSPQNNTLEYFNVPKY